MNRSEFIGRTVACAITWLWIGGAFAAAVNGAADAARRTTATSPRSSRDRSCCAIRTYLAVYRLEGRPEDLAKARALGDTATRVQFPDGRLPTWWWPSRAKLVYADWLNCMLVTAGALLELDAVK